MSSSFSHVINALNDQVPAVNNDTFNHLKAAVKTMGLPFIALDSSLFQILEDGTYDDGAACRKKFSNSKRGVDSQGRDTLSKFADAILADDFDLETLGHDALICFDALTILSNHIDQHGKEYGRFEMALNERENLVLRLLEAANKINPIKSFDDSKISSYSSRELSSHAQFLQYYGKALRYDFSHKAMGKENSAFIRLPLFQQAARINVYLDKKAEKAEDVHYYIDREATIRVIQGYCYKDIGQYEDAIAINSINLQTATHFNKGQSFKEINECYLALINEAIISGQSQSAGHLKGRLEKNLQEFAHIRATVSGETIETNIYVSDMKIHLLNGNTDEARKHAEMLLDTNHPDCPDAIKVGIKENHIKEANDVLAQIEHLHTKACRV